MVEGYHRLMADAWAGLWREDDGVTAVEYGLIAALLFLVMAVGVKALGTKSSNMYSSIRSAIEAAE
ncbi:Flp/Fap pilin component [compost metagenome]